jgi:hypothetical protein
MRLIPLFSRATHTTCLLTLLCGARLGAQITSGSTILTGDGGTRETLESIFIPPKLNASFSLTLETEWIRPLPHGGTYTAQNRRHIMRDSAGRIHQERWLLTPKNGKLQSTMNYIQVSDPAAHTLYNCEVVSKRCYLLTYTGSTAIAYKPSVGATETLPDGMGFRSHESLGTNTVAGFDAEGYRETVTLNPWVEGNDQPMVTTWELWYSPHFGISLLSMLDSPRVGKQVFTVTEITASEPEHSLFTVPAGYSVVDRRKTEAPSD